MRMRVWTTKIQSEKISATADFIENRFWRSMMSSAAMLGVRVRSGRKDDGGCCFLKVIDSSLAGALGIPLAHVELAMHFSIRRWQKNKSENMPNLDRLEYFKKSPMFLET